MVRRAHVIQSVSIHNREPSPPHTKAPSHVPPLTERWVDKPQHPAGHGSAEATTASSLRGLLRGEVTAVHREGAVGVAARLRLMGDDQDGCSPIGCLAQEA